MAIKSKTDPYDQILMMLESESNQTTGKASDPVDWMESNFYCEHMNGEIAPISLYPHQKRILKDITYRDDNGRFPWRTIIYSTVKKSGKTTLAAAFGLWYAWNESPYNEIFVAANDKEQSQGRIFAHIWKSLHTNNVTQSIVGDNPIPGKNQDRIVLPNGTKIEALPHDYSGAAGSNHGLVLMSELWAFMTEKSRRLYDELTPVPTRLNSLRFIETYAGFKGESDLLWEFYEKYVVDVNGNRRMDNQLYPAGFEVDGEQYDWSLPVHVDRDAGIYVYWDEEPRMPWQTEEYYRQQKAELRPSAFVRLHENKWVDSESAFVTESQWDACVYHPTDEIWKEAEDLPIVGAGDASTKKDTTGQIAVSYHPSLDIFFIRDVKKWEAKESAVRDERIVNLNKTIRPGAQALFDDRGAIAYYYDPYQLHSIMISLAEEGYKTIEFSQGGQRSKADQALYDYIINERIVAPPNPYLKRHVLNARAKENSSGHIRIVKPKQTEDDGGDEGDEKKVDLAVATSMACYGALEQWQEENERKRKFKSVPFLAV